MSIRDATKAQVAAADPAASAWLSANAGSGKTRVLTDRVAWLLLNGARPERILCLTFTKAAAAEMQNRLFARLGEWAMLDDTALSEKLTAMGVGPDARDPERLRRARTLFASAIEAPGGLKIQTIHAFAASVLRRFPLEAGVSPGFQEIEDRARVMLMDAVLDALAEGPQAGAIADVAAHASGSDLRKLMEAVLGARDAFSGSAKDIRAWLGLAQGFSADDLIAQTFDGVEAVLCKRAAGLLDPEKRGAKALIKTLTEFPFDAPTLADLARIEKVFVNGSDTATAPDAPKIGSFANKDVRAALGDDLAPLEAFMERLATARPLRRALMTAERAEALDRFARAFVPAFDAAKEARGWLDFSDLIRCARTLLTDRGIAPWILFRLDGGIDHLLVDEAQDTSPEQWDIVKALAEEFAAGEGARAGVTRTLFVVGDVKQSIYSFQGADPEGFERMRAHFEEQLQASPAPLSSRELVYSFRSSPLILSLVDAVAEGPAQTGIGDAVRHAAVREGLPGRIDIWPVIDEGDQKAEEKNWYDPTDLPNPAHPDAVLAERVADFIAETIENPPMIRGEAGDRPVEPGDILVLVRRRKRLFFRLIQEIKARGLPILGADSFAVADQLAVRDLVAMLKVLATRADDLSLASVLRSPVFGFSDDDLFRLAHGREGALWAELSGEPAEILHDLRRKAGTLRPYELLERALTFWGLRTRIVARLGAEAEDGIDALLAQALAYERSEVPSLTGFIAWLEADELKIKRDAGQAKGQIRVMTVHGAKGLEAPVVILPETAIYRSARTGPRVIVPDGGPALWPGGKDDNPNHLRERMAADHAADMAEQDRLLYVAITRAAQWLVVGAAGKVASKNGVAEQESWYGAVEAAAKRIGAREVPAFGATGLRLELGDWSPREQPDAKTPPAPILPDWVKSRAPGLAMPKIATPSDLGGAKALPGDPGAGDQVAAMRKGRLIHLLLEHLPRLAAPAWAAAAPGILALDGPDLPDDAETAGLLDEASAVLAAPALEPLFAAETLAEVGVTGHSATLNCQMIGQIDRLVVENDRVLAVDFKSNALVPDTLSDVPEGLLRQMGAYAELLTALYPKHRVETAILWTSQPLMMPLPHDVVMAALARAATS